MYYLVRLDNASLSATSLVREEDGGMALRIRSSFYELVLVLLQLASSQGDFSSCFVERAQGCPFYDPSQWV